MTHKIRIGLKNIYAKNVLVVYKLWTNGIFIRKRYRSGEKLIWKLSIYGLIASLTWIQHYFHFIYIDHKCLWPKPVEHWLSTQGPLGSYKVINRWVTFQWNAFAMCVLCGCNVSVTPHIEWRNNYCSKWKRIQRRRRKWRALEVTHMHIHKTKMLIAFSFIPLSLWQRCFYLLCLWKALMLMIIVFFNPNHNLSSPPHWASAWLAIVVACVCWCWSAFC